MAEQIHGHVPPNADVEDVLADPAGACPDCVRIVIERLCHDLDVQRAAMATMLEDERQMQAAHDRTRAELDAARAELARWEGHDAVTATLVKQAEAERDRLAEQVKRDRASIVRLAQSWARHGKGAMAAELLTEFEMDEGEVLGTGDGS